MQHVVILLVPGAYLSAAWGLRELFEYAEKLVPGSFEPRFAEVQDFIEEARSASRTGTAGPACSAGCAPLSDIVIIPPFRSDSMQEPTAGFRPEPSTEAFRCLADALRAHAEQGATLCSVCAGAFYLCAAGIADGKSATTHWSLAEALARMFQKVQVEAERMLIDNGSFITAGGLTAWQDLGLHLIRKTCGREAALETAEAFLINPSDRSQLAYMRKALELPEADGTVAQAIGFMRAECGSAIGLRETAAFCGVTVRTLLRRFAAAGVPTPGTVLQDIRMEKARKLLSTGTASVKETALECGYADQTAFARAFRARSGMTPAEYRRRFSSL